MSIFICQRCGKEFKKKYNYDRHVMGRKTECKKTPLVPPFGHNLLKKDPKKTQNDEKGLHDMFLMAKTGQNGGKSLRKKPITALFPVDLVDDGNKHYECENCGTTFTTNAHKKRHIKNNRCHGNKIHHQLLEIKQILKDNEKNSKKESIFNQQINNYTQINNYMDVKKNAFGEENVDHLTNNLLDKVIKNPQMGIIRLIKAIHFDPKFPENMNVKMNNKKEPYLDVYDGEKWEKKDKTQTIQNLLVSKKDIMDDFYDLQTEKDLVGDFLKENYEQFSDLLDLYVSTQLHNVDEEKKKLILERCQEVYRLLQTNVELMLVNSCALLNKEKKELKNEKEDNGDNDNMDK